MKFKNFIINQTKDYFDSEYFWQNFFIYLLTSLSIGRGIFFLYPDLIETQKSIIYEALSIVFPLQLLGLLLMLSTFLILSSTFSISTKGKVALLIGAIVYTIIYLILSVNTFKEVGEWFFSYKYMIHGTFSILLAIKTGFDLCKKKST